MQKDLITAYHGRVLQAKDLPALPKVVREVYSMINSKNLVIEDLAKLIENDQSITVKIIKLINSPIYGFPGRITSVRHALVLLGINVIGELVLSIAIQESVPEGIAGLWEHCKFCGIASVIVAREAKLRYPEEYSVMGSLHDLGKAIFIMQIPEALKDVNALVKDGNLLFREAEKKILGYTHCEINAWICDNWNLPVVLKEAISYHHAPLSAMYNPKAAAVVHIADFMVRMFEFGSSGDDQVPALEPKALSMLGLNHSAVERIMYALMDAFLIEKSS